MTIYVLKLILNPSTDVAVKETIPTKFELSQNYPNPFNPTTTISYSLAKSETVKLTVFNMLGQNVAELVNKKQQAGNYLIKWNATNNSGIHVPSGVYFYRLEAGSFVKTNKMILLK